MIDARGLRCPWPALRLARAMREAVAAGSSAELVIVTDDPAAHAELAALAAERGWRIESRATPLGPGFSAKRP